MMRSFSSTLAHVVRFWLRDIAETTNNFKNYSINISWDNCWRIYQNIMNSIFYKTIYKWVVYLSEGSAARYVPLNE